MFFFFDMFFFFFFFFFFQAEDGIRDLTVTGVQTCALPISLKSGKEAEVFLLERRYASGSIALLAHKRYRPRRPSAGELRDLGFKRARSEERRVGKECRSRWSQYH